MFGVPHQAQRGAPVCQVGPAPPKCDACGSTETRTIATSTGDRICVDHQECLARMEAQGIPVWTP